MKSIKLAMLISILALLPAFGQDFRPMGKVTVPFEFAGNNIVLPAGDYQIMTPRQHLVTLRNVDTSETVTTLVADVAIDSVAIENRLVFRQDGGRSVLHQAILAGDFHGHDLTHGKAVPELPSR